MNRSHIVPCFAFFCFVFRILFSLVPKRKRKKYSQEKKTNKHKHVSCFFTATSADLCSFSASRHIPRHHTHTRTKVLNVFFFVSFKYNSTILSNTRSACDMYRTLRDMCIQWYTRTNVTAETISQTKYGNKLKYSKQGRVQSQTFYFSTESAALSPSSRSKFRL